MQGCALLSSTRLWFVLHDAIEKESRVAKLVSLCLTDHSKSRHVANRGESFTTEPEACDLAQIIEPRNLTRGEAFAQDCEVLLLDAVPIVLDLKQAHSTVLAQNADGCGACVN